MHRFCHVIILCVKKDKNCRKFSSQTTLLIFNIIFAMQKAPFSANVGICKYMKYEMMKENVCIHFNDCEWIWKFCFLHLSTTMCTKRLYFYCIAFSCFHLGRESGNNLGIRSVGELNFFFFVAPWTQFTYVHIMSS